MSSKKCYRSKACRTNNTANNKKNSSIGLMSDADWNRHIITCKNATLKTQEQMTVREAKIKMRNTIRDYHVESLRCYNLLLNEKQMIEAQQGVGSVQMAESKWKVRIAFYANLYNNNVEKAQYKRDKWVRYATEELETFMENGEKGNKFVILEDPNNPLEEVLDINENAIINWANCGKEGLETLDELLEGYKFLWRC